MSPQVIHFDYVFSPYGQKTKLLLAATKVPFLRVDQPLVLPRKDLEELGITYRRIPVLAVGKDVYVDSALIIDVILDTLVKSTDAIPRTPADKAFETYGYEVFLQVLALIDPKLLSPDFVNDRKTIFPIVDRPDFKTLRPSGLAEFQSRAAYIEDVLLANGPYIGGNKLSVADIHVIWSYRWALNDLGAKQEKGLGKSDFPKLWHLIESLPEPKPEKELTGAEAIKAIKEAEYSVKNVSIASDDPLGLAAGTPVSVESIDSTPGSHPQLGNLIGSSRHEIVLELESGVHLHFPRNGYIVREAKKSHL